MPNRIAIGGSERMETRPPGEPSSTSVIEAQRFCKALFRPDDLVLFRPIETWQEGGRKRSRVDYPSVDYRRVANGNGESLLAKLISGTSNGRENLFFGVCPRFGGGGRFDLAWQIRTVRALWADLDQISVQDALGRVSCAGLPPPSIVVNSGNGAHLYWLLDPVFQIDDAGDPLAVETEWAEDLGRSSPRRYIVRDGEREYLEQRRHVSQLSPKAERVQNILAGIAKVVGGDHTTDLSRLLRIPGSLNRKDERNGRPAVPTSLVECDPDRRYPVEQFTEFAVESPQVERARQIAQMPLPRPRKLSAGKNDKLDELLAASSIAPPGSRSEADFALCCYAIRHGVPRDELAKRVESIGKFAEQGTRYFDTTWANAEYDVRYQAYEKVRAGLASKSPNPGDGASAQAVTVAAGTTPEADRDSDRPTIQVDPSQTPVGETMSQITEHLVASGTCFSRAGQLVSVLDQDCTAVLSAAELAGHLNQMVEFFFIGPKSAEFKPLPASYANTWLNHPGESRRLPVIDMYSRNPVYTSDWRLVQPGYDAASRIYYAGPTIEPRDGTEHLDALLKDFCFLAPADRTNYIGMMLTVLLMPSFLGSKPAVLFNGNQPELGKSILAQTLAILRDGQPVETATYNPNDEEFEKRLGAIVRRGATTIIIDNARGKGRNAKIDSPCLERSITDSILSFRLLGSSDSIRAENSHIFCITANAPDVSRDLVTRSVVINLHYEGNPEHRTYSIADPEGYAQEHRIELLGELIGMVERWRLSGMPHASTHSRFNKRGWGNVIGGILDACGEPDFLANADEAASLLDDTRREFDELVAILVDHPQGTWTAAELASLCEGRGILKHEMGEGTERSKATKVGGIAGRYVAERFDIPDGRTVVFHKEGGRKGSVYRVGIAE